VRVLCGHLSVGWCYDRLDVRRDIAVGRDDKPLMTGAVPPRAVAVGCALALCVPLSLANGLPAGIAHLVGVVAAWSYNLGAKCTALSPLLHVLGWMALISCRMESMPWMSST
jgi:hypothetical protein